ncbi:MAG: Gfo/Idh/MocA family oxidoreductase [Candidatus Margulisbacteria bacterium]|nr:Gfo/Idh/MocA family oxidoreductase [Candidatus Margulisiibacteriota bacterium]
MKTVKIGIIGFGYWGPNLARNFFALDGCQVKYIVDLSPARLAAAKKLYPSVNTTDKLETVLDDAEIDAVVIASPVSTHFQFAQKALVKGKHVLVEKPMTRLVSEAEELIALAKKQGRVLMVDHTFLYTGAVKKIKEMIKSDQLGKIQYFDSTRINLGLFQHDINVIGDLAPHDLSILSYLVDEAPASVIATGVSHTDNKVENLAYLTLNYQSAMIAHFTLSWSSPVKIRKTLIAGTKKMVVYDDLEPTEKVRVYDTGFKASESQNLLIDYRVGDIYIPKIEQTEALSALAKDFLAAITTGKAPLADAQKGLAVVRILESAEKSLKNHGQEVKLS